MLPAVLPDTCSSSLTWTRIHGHQGGWGGTPFSPTPPSVFRMAIPPCCPMLHEAVVCNPVRGSNVGGRVSIPVQHPLHCSCAETVMFAWFGKMQKTCKICCCLKFIYVQTQKECDELHWERAKPGKQATPLEMKLNFDKCNIMRIERNDLSYKYTQMVPELAAVSCNKELDFAANSSQSAQRMGKQKHLGTLRKKENDVLKISACTYM